VRGVCGEHLIPSKHLLPVLALLCARLQLSLAGPHMQTQCGLLLARLSGLLRCESAVPTIRAEHHPTRRLVFRRLLGSPLLQWMIQGRLCERGCKTWRSAMERRALLFFRGGLSRTPPKRDITGTALTGRADSQNEEDGDDDDDAASVAGGAVSCC